MPSVPSLPQPTHDSLPHVNGEHLATERSWHWRLLRWPARFLAWSLFDLQVYGRRHVPLHGGVLIVCNHQSNLDPVLVGARLGRPVNYIAKSELFHRRLAAQLIRGLNGFPVKQGKGDVGAVKETIRRLRNGHLVNIYPEGARTPDGAIHPLLKGAALIIRRAKVPVIPAVIVGAFEAWPIQRRFPRPSPVCIRFGRAMRFDGMESDDQITAAIEEKLRRMFAQLQSRIRIRHEAKHIEASTSAG